MSDDRDNLHEQLDACRRPEDDLQSAEMAELRESLESDPELRERLHRSLRVDELFRAALHDVPIPPGLEERLCGILAQQEATSAGNLNARILSDRQPGERIAGPGQEAAAGSAADIDLRLDAELLRIAGSALSESIGSREAVSPAGDSRPHASSLHASPVQAAVDDASSQGDTAVNLPQQRTSWRTGLRWVTVPAAAAALLLAVWWWGSPGGWEFHSQEDAAEHTAEWLTELVPNRWSGHNPPFDRFPAPAPFTRSIYRWQQVGAGEMDVVCYNLDPTASLRVYLFVCQPLGGTTLPATPPLKPTAIADRRFASWSVGAWRPSDAAPVYVLAVETGEQRYRQLIQPRGTIALHRGGVVELAGAAAARRQTARSVSLIATASRHFR